MTNSEVRKSLIFNLTPYHSVSHEKIKKLVDDIEFDDRGTSLRSFFEKMIDLSKKSSDFTRLGNLILCYLDDEQWGKETYLKALELADNFTDYDSLLYMASWRFKGDEMLRGIYEKALSQCGTTGEYLSLACIIDNLGVVTPIETDAIYEKAYELLTDNPKEYAEVAIHFLENPAKGREIAKLMDKAMELSSFRNLIDVCEQFERGKLDDDCTHDPLQGNIVEKMTELIYERADSVEDYLLIADSCITSPYSIDDPLENAIGIANSFDDYMELAEYFEEGGDKTKAKEQYLCAIEKLDEDDPDEKDKIEEFKAKLGK